MKNARDGDLYRKITVFDKTFELYYGYYDERDKESRYREPIPIYPDFIKSPVYTSDGYRYATEMQDICSHFSGREGEDSCFACRHFQKGEELIGLCRCESRMKGREDT
ncbi:MAG: hypothetical protein IJV74_05140 [Clostridia bacterium]|nr:hypothetical protein [Clostridia bacterium]